MRAISIARSASTPLASRGKEIDMTKDNIVPFPTKEPELWFHRPAPTGKGSKPIPGSPWLVVAVGACCALWAVALYCIFFD